MNNKMIRFTIMLVMCCFPFSRSDAQSMNNANEMASVHQLDKGLLKLENDILFKTIALDLEGVHISQALQTIADVADLKLMYSEDLLLNEKVVSLKKPSVSLYEALWDVLNGTGLQYAISPNRQLVIVKGEEETGEPIEKLVQETVSGRVVDSQTGEPLPGVNIFIEGTTIGTNTDANGYYELSLESLDVTLVYT